MPDRTLWRVEQGSLLVYVQRRNFNIYGTLFNAQKVLYFEKSSFRLLKYSSRLEKQGYFNKRFFGIPKWLFYGIAAETSVQKLLFSKYKEQYF